MRSRQRARDGARARASRSEEHTSELQSRRDLVCRLLLEKKNTYKNLINCNAHSLQLNIILYLVTRSSFCPAYFSVLVTYVEMTPSAVSTHTVVIHYLNIL